MHPAFGRSGTSISLEVWHCRFMRSLVIALTLLATPALADMAGVASAIDGDTIEVHGQTIRLHEIDAPESRQLCFIDGKPWRCERFGPYARVVARQRSSPDRMSGSLRRVGR